MLYLQIIRTLSTTALVDDSPGAVKMAMVSIYWSYRCCSLFAGLRVLVCVTTCFRPHLDLPILRWTSVPVCKAD